MPQSRLDLVDKQGEFYRNNFRRLIKITYIFIIVIFLLLAFIFYQFFTTLPPKYFATTQDGRLVEVIPLPRE